jgi:hypothetical protein
VRLLAVFSCPDELVAALQGLKRTPYTVKRVFSPLHLPEVQELLYGRPAPMRLITLLGGLVGALSVLGMAIYAHLSFSLITSGKPVLPVVPWVVVGFEGTILGAVLAATLGWILAGRLPKFSVGAEYDPRFSQDRFGLLCTCIEEDAEPMRRLLEKAGAEDVRHV